MNEKQKITRSRSKDPLLTVVKRNYLEMAELLIKQGADVTCFDNEPIIEAVRNDNFDMVKLLIDSGADAAARNNEPLKIAIRGAKYGNPEIMDYLILNGADSSLVDESMYDILEDAVEHGNVKMAEYIISNGADVTYNDNKVICIATSSPYCFHFKEMLELLVSAGANVNARHGYPLIATTACYSYNNVASLIENGADIHACEHCALMIAKVRKNQYDNLFYEAGIDPDFPTSFEKSLEYASKHKYKDIVELLIRKKDDDMLVYAAGKGYIETVKFLLNSGYKGDKIWALGVACDRNFEDVADAIIDSGCDFINHNLSYDLIVDAVMNGSMKLVKKLLNAGAPLSEKAFFEAASCGEVEILKVLLSSDKLYAEEALKGAFESGDINIVEFITSNYISISSCFIDDLLRSAIYGENTELIKLVIDNGVEPDQIFKICRGAVFNIIEIGNYELLIFLLDLGMKASVSMLESAVFRDQVKCAKVLLEKGVLPTDEIIQEVLDLGRTEILEAFFDAGVPII